MRTVNNEKLPSGEYEIDLDGVILEGPFKGKKVRFGKRFRKLLERENERNNTCQDRSS